MARNNGGNNNGGYLLLIIGMLLLVGNVALFDGSFAELPLLCVFAIIADIFIIVTIIKAIVGKSSKNNSSQASDDQPASRQPDAGNVPPSFSDPASAAIEDNSKLNQLKSKYRVPDVPSLVAAVDPLQKGTEAYQCIEVLRNVSRAISRRRDSAKKMKCIKEEIDGILACSECGTDRERFKNIKSNEETLLQKKAEYAAVSAEMKKIQAVLLSKEKAAFNKLSAALAEICSSEKSASKSGVALSSFIKLRSSIPGDLFVSEQAPIELDYGAYKFFLLPDVILAYDEADSFVTAFEPMTLIITIKDREKGVYVQRSGGSTWSYTDSVIANDSVLISEGYVRTRWLHEKKSGGPDLRYSYNPRCESRTDIYAYSDFVIQIGQYKAEYSISKAAVSDKLKPMVTDYCSLMHEPNAVPSLLRLLESASKNKETAGLLSEKYESAGKNIICKVS